MAGFSVLVRKGFVLFVISLLFSSVLSPVSVAVSKSGAIVVPGTDESPFDLILKAVGHLDSICNGSGSDKFSVDLACKGLKCSVDSDFWDGYHVKTGQAFVADLAAVKLLESTDAYKDESGPNNQAVVSCIIAVLQSDRGLASIMISDASNASLRVSDSLTLRLMNKSVEQARKDFSKAEDQLLKGNDKSAIEFYGKAWLEAWLALSLADNKIAPGVTIVAPINGSYVNTSATTVAGTVDDVAVYSIGNVTLTVNGKSSVVSLSDGTYAQQVQLKEGVNNIQVTAKDLYGNKGTASSKVVLDTVEPIITIMGVSDGRFYNSTVQPLVNISDANPGSSSIMLDGTVYNGDVVSDEGFHLLHVEATDLAGNSAGADVNFVVDRMAPVAEIYGLQVNSYPGKSVMIDGGMADANPGNLSLRIDGVEVSTGLPYLWNTTGYPDGNHTVELYVTDKALNTGSTSIQVIVDNTPPTIKILVPANGYLSPSDMIKFL
jgi:hypothetical protein